ncbi:MAG: hypothetical protein ACRBCK_02330 [Alphaproteobacteria bacterium]
MQAAKKTSLFGTSSANIDTDTQAFFGGLFAQTSDTTVAPKPEHNQNDVSWNVPDTLDM